MFGVSKRDYFTVRNEWWRDEDGERSASALLYNYTSHTIGWGHQLSDVIMIRPEIGYADAKAFDLGRKNYLWAGRVDGTWPG